MNLVFLAIGVLEERKRCLALLEVPELRRHCRLMNRENLAIHVWQEGIKELADRKIVWLALKDISAPSRQQLRELVHQVAIGRRLLRQQMKVGLFVSLAKQVNTNPKRHNLLAFHARPGTFAPSLQHLRSNAVASLFTALQRVPL